MRNTFVNTPRVHQMVCQEITVRTQSASVPTILGCANSIRVRLVFDNYFQTMTSLL